MKITIYELLGLIKDEPNRYIYVKYFDRVNRKKDVMWACKENIIYKLEHSLIELNDEVEILEEEKKIPEKIDVISWDKCIHGVTHKEKELAIQINKTQELLNQVIDYLKSKGE